MPPDHRRSKAPMEFQLFFVEEKKQDFYRRKSLIVILIILNIKYN